MHYKGTAYQNKDYVYFDVDDFHSFGRRASNYRTFFHEMSHAADYSYGQRKCNGNYTTIDYVDKNGNTLNDYLKADVENRIRTEVDEYIEKKNLNLTAEEKKKLEDDVTHLIMNTADYKNDPPKIDDAMTKKCYKSVVFSIKIDLAFNAGEASDVYGGYTGNTVSYWQHDADYWYTTTTDANGNEVPAYDENGDLVRTTKQPLECFAECMAGMITDCDSGMDGYNYYSEDVQNTFNDIASEMAGTN